MDDTLEFLSNVNTKVAQENVSRSKTFWKSLSVPEPTIGVSFEGSIHFSWRSEDIYLECEFGENGDIEGFYEDEENSYIEEFETPESASSWIQSKIE